MIYSAHSPDKQTGIDAQPYKCHIMSVIEKATKNASEVCKYATTDREVLLHITKQAAVFHDLGKLDKANQVILNGIETAKKLPVNHVDAGSAFFLTEENYSYITAMLIQAHHKGFCDAIDEFKNEEKMFRDSTIYEYINNILNDLLSIHNSLINENNIQRDIEPEGNLSIFLRIALSCLVDADHTDTAIHYHDHPEPPPYIPLRPRERLEKLDNHVKSLGLNESKRSSLRNEMYEVCRNANTDDMIVSCDSPVGSGKTTAIMAHLLQQAKEKCLRRIIIVLPFTNIIQQSVKVYRKALCLDGENPYEVVAELHHRADFQDKESRYLTALWRAPIIVTTAVAFFETLASNSPSTFSRLHELPGSAIFLDESHAALPIKYLPLAWHWINCYSKEWSCYWVLASGSLNRFWNIKGITQGENCEISELVDTDIREQLSFYEKNRIKYQCDLIPKGLNELAEWVVSFPGPRLVIVNTVQNAAIIADYFSKVYGRDRVEHLSTALTPIDRDIKIKHIKKRLRNKSDINWTLIATSCVEAGIDISFRTGFRELSSLLSLLQAAGRINREGIFEYSEIWTFKLKESDNFNINPSFQFSRNILQKYFEEGKDINPELSTESINDEIMENGVSSIYIRLLEYEKNNRFPKVEEMFKVIESDTKLVLINEEIINAVKNHRKVSWQEIQNHSVRIYGYNLEKYGINDAQLQPGIYQWPLEYDDFLGIMKGALPVIRAISGDGLIA